MVARKSHPKSRNGCAQCKRRRIKCDEVKPQCTNCMKHEIDCDFATAPSKSVDGDTSPISTPPMKRKRTEDEIKGYETRNTASQTTERSNSRSTIPHRSDPKPLPMEELELLHHFITETSKTLSDREESHQIWRVTVPKIAFEHEFLMRGILAISALHLSYLRPGEHDSFYRIAIRQQGSALSSFRSTMNHMSEENCDAFFAMSTLVVVYGFESPKASDNLGMFSFSSDSNATPSQSEDWLPLIRGVNFILHSFWQTVKQGRLHRLLHDQPSKPAAQSLPEMLDTQLRKLDLLSQTPHLPDTPPDHTLPDTPFSPPDHGTHASPNASSGAYDPQEQEDLQSYATAVQHLRECLGRVVQKSPDECEVSLAFLWPVWVPQRYLNQLQSRAPAALIVLAHYCVILQHLNGYWWLRGWAKHILGSIQRELPARLQGWIAWPVRCVGLIPSATSTPVERQLASTPTEEGNTYEGGMVDPIELCRRQRELSLASLEMKNDEGTETGGGASVPRGMGMLLRQAKSESFP